jgi:hypothetical protein
MKSINRMPRKNETPRILIHIAAGTVAGAVLLHPLTMVIYSVQLHMEGNAVGPLGRLIWDSIHCTFTLRMLPMAVECTLLGGIIGLCTGFYSKLLIQKQRLKAWTDRRFGEEIESLLQRNEGPTLEFKASFRWDRMLGKVNKELEKVVLKTVAGFANHEGGDLLIGVTDEKSIAGLEEDFQTLKRRDRDGFEQLLMRSIKDGLGADVCSLVHVVFHQVEGKDICRVIVEPSPRPVYVQIGNHTQYFVRVGNSTYDFNVKEALAHIASQSHKTRVA